MADDNTNPDDRMSRQEVYQRIYDANTDILVVLQNAVIALTNIATTLES